MYRTLRNALALFGLLFATVTAHAAHETTACPPQTATVANGGSVEIDISDCDAYNFGFGNGVPFFPLAPTLGTVVLRQEGVPPTPPSTTWIARSILTYTHTATTNPATQDVFEIDDLDNLNIRFTITIQAPTSSIVVSPASITLRTGLAVDQQLSATGGTGPYTFTINSGSLPPGLSMTPQGRITGTPTTRSNFSFTVRAQDSTGASALKTYSGVIGNPVFGVAPSPLTLLQNVPANVQMNGTGGTAPYTFPADISVSLPPGLAISTSGVLTGTPTVLGTTNAQLLVNDSTTDPMCPGCDFFGFVTVPMTVTSTLPVISVSVAGSPVLEDGSANLVFTVSRNVALASATVVNISTSGTATAGSDYTGNVATVTIPAGATTATITINPTPDTTVEPDETVTLTVAAGTGYTVGAPSSATGTISNDDINPTTLTLTKVSNGGVGAFTFTGTNGWSSQTITTTSPGVGVSGATQTLAASAVATTITEALPAGYILSGASCTGMGAGGTATLSGNSLTLNAAATAAGSNISCTFTNVRLPTLTLTKVSNGGIGAFTFTGTNGWSSQTITTTTPGVGVSGATQTLSSPSTATTITEAVPAGYVLTGASCTGMGAGGTATLSGNALTLNGAATAAGANIACNFTNTAVPNLTINDVTLSEGNAGITNFTFTVSLSVPAGPGGVTFDLATANGSATAGSDYVAQSLTGQTIPAGSSTYIFTVLVNGDLLNEPTETFFVNVTSVLGANVVDGQAVGTITNDDPLPQINTSSISVLEGNSGTTNAVVTVTLNAASGQTVTVNYATADGTATQPSDYTSTSGTLTFTPGTVSQTITVPVIGDTLPEANEIFSVGLFGATNATINVPTSFVTITNDDVPVTVNPATLPNGTFGVSYSQTATASGGVGAYGFAVTSGALPGGLTLAPNGAITGTPNAAGAFNFTITATDSSPAPGPFTGSRAYTVNIAQGTQTVTFAPASPVVFGVTPITLTATATSGLTTFTFSTSSANTICTVAGNQLTITGAGVCNLTATQSGNANYLSAVANASVTINPATQTVTFAPASPVVFGVTPITLTATATSSLTAFTFTTTSAITICTVAGNQVTITGAGVCNLTATQPGNANYQSASANASVTINPATQTVTFAPATPVVFGAAPVALTATATSGLTSFTFSTSSAATICTVSGNTVTFTGGGACALTATQPGNASYQSASATATIVVNPATQTVTFTPTTPVTFGAAPGTLSATASSGLTAFTFSTSSPVSVCTVAGSTVTYIGGGNCSLTATQAGNASYQSASATATVAINPASQTVSFAPATPVTFGVSPITLSATTSSGLTIFTFSTSSPNTVCTVSGNQLTIVGVGSCALTATQPGNANYQSASANATVVINPASQTVTFTPTTPVNFGTGPYTLTATSSSGLTAFTFSTTAAASICTVSGNQLTVVGIGSCPLTASQAGNANYQPASASATVTINAVVAGAPTMGAATPGNGQASIAFTPPASIGGAPITSYTVTCNPGSIASSGPTSPVTVTGLTNGTAYSCTVAANNTAGSSAPSAGVTVTPRTVPGAPTIGAATPARGQATIEFAPPTSDGGSPITGYTARCVSIFGAVTAVGTSSPIVVTGLIDGMSYQCSVVANNLVGASAASAVVTFDLPVLPVPLNVGVWLIALLMLAAGVGVQRRRHSER